MKRTGEDIIRDNLIRVEQKIHGENAAIGIAGILALIGPIFELLRGCSSESRAAQHVNRGSAIVRRKVENMLNEQGYHGDAKEAAKEIAKRGKKLSKSELAVILDEAKDDPTPPPQPAGGFWPSWD